MEGFKGLFWVAIIFLFIGFGLLAVVQHRHAFRHGIFRSLSTGLSDTNKRLLVFGFLFLFGGAISMMLSLILK